MILGCVPAGRAHLGLVWFSSGAVPRCFGTSLLGWMCWDALWPPPSLTKLLCAVASPTTLVSLSRAEKRAPARSHVTVLSGTAGTVWLGISTGSVPELVLLRARTGFVFVRCLCYRNGGCCSSPAMVQGSLAQLRQDLLQASGPACNHFGPTANKKVYAQCANKVRARSIYLHCRCHF